MTGPIYLDYQATTPMDERVLKAMMPYLTGKFGNPHSASHRFGWEGAAAVEVAQKQIATLIGAEAAEIVFTSGATESNNLAIKGVLAAARETGRDHLVTVATEHKCVLESAAACARAGFRVTVLPVGADGLVDSGRVADAITPSTALVSVMAVNNEIGVIQPLAEIGKLAHAAGALMHTDAAQGFGKIPLDVRAMNIDLMSISGHKIYGPKGIGALYVAKQAKRRLAPQMSGGGQQDGIRPGTLAPALCAGLGQAAKVAAAEMERDAAHVAALRDRLLAGILAAVPDTVLNGDSVARYAGNLNLSFPGRDAAKLLLGLKKLAISSGAACASAETGPSYVLAALGLPRALAASALRIGFGRFTTVEEIDVAVAEIARAAKGSA